MTDEILRAERELPAPLKGWLRQAAADPEREYRSANSLLEAARDAGVQFDQVNRVTGASREAPALALYRYLRTLRFGDGSPDLDVPAASLETAEQNLEQVGNAGVLEEGPAYATVAMGHALVVLAKSLERIETHLSVIAEHVARTAQQMDPGSVFKLEPGVDHPDLPEPARSIVRAMRGTGRTNNDAKAGPRVETRPKS